MFVSFKRLVIKSINYMNWLKTRSKTTKTNYDIMDGKTYMF